MKELFNKPTHKFHIRELARKTGLNPNTIISFTDDLEEESIIGKEKKKHIVEISLNLENPATLQKKKFFNLSEIHDSGLIDFLVEEYNHPKSIILFGSYARGEDIERGDVDIMINTVKKEIVDLSKFEKKLKRKIHPFLFSEKEIKNMKKQNKELLNNILNGVILFGYINVL